MCTLYAVRQFGFVFQTNLRSPFGLNSRYLLEHIRHRVHVLDGFHLQRIHLRDPGMETEAR